MSNQVEAITSDDLRSRILWSVDPGAEAERSRLVDGQANHDDLIGVAGEDFTRVPHAIDAIADARDGFVQVQLASILRNCSP